MAVFAHGSRVDARHCGPWFFPVAFGISRVGLAKLQAIKAELRRRMHEPVAAVGAWLRKVVNGFECLWATLATNVVAQSKPTLYFPFAQDTSIPISTPPQSKTQVVAPSTSALPALNSSPTRSASLSYSSFPRNSSKVGAVCVEARAISDGRPYRVTWKATRNFNRRASRQAGIRRPRTPG